MLLLPVVLLAIASAIEGLLACAADLVLSYVALWGTAEAALLHKSHILFAFLSGLGLELQLLDVLEPLLGCIVHPRVDEGDGFAANVLLRKLLGRKLVDEVILLFLANEIKAVLEVRLNYLDSDLSSLLLVSLALLLLTHAVVGEGP